MSLPHLLALSHFQKIGPAGYKKLIAIVGNAEGIWRATHQELLAAEIKPSTTDEFITWRATVNLQQLVDEVARANISVVTINDSHYPRLLREISDPPYLLYYRGKLPEHDALCIGIVGSREPTMYGRTIAHDFARDLAASGATVISGLAQGIDQEAHRGAVAVHGRTVAVLGCGMLGIDTGYKARIAEEIISNGGAVITEYIPHDGSPDWHFPLRNRIISGMSKGTVVVEAALDSGSLITAKAALDQNREVFAVPGSIHAEMSKGTNALLRQGAHPVTCAQDILVDLQMELVSLPEIPAQLSPTETTIYNLLNKTPQHVDDIALAAGLPTPTVAGTLATLEIQGVVRNLGGMRYIR